jgi:Domain of unknown function (DUF4131)
MPLLWLSLAFLIGIALAASLPLKAAGWLILAGGAVLLAVLRPLSRRVNIPTTGALQQINQRITPFFNQIHLGIPWFALLLTIALGGLRFQLRQPDLSDPGHIVAYNDNEILYQVEGMLLAPPELRDGRADLRLRAARLIHVDHGAEMPVSGLLLAIIWNPQDWHYGDRLRLQGYLETPASGEAFDYRQYLARQGIYSTMQSEQIDLLARDQGESVLVMALCTERARPGDALPVVSRSGGVSGRWHLAGRGERYPSGGGARLPG